MLPNQGAFTKTCIKACIACLARKSYNQSIDMLLSNIYESAECITLDFIKKLIQNNEVIQWIRTEFTDDFRFLTSVYMLAILKRSPRQKSQLKNGYAVPYRHRLKLYY